MCLSARKLIPFKPRAPDITREIQEDEEKRCQTESPENRRRLSRRARQSDNLSERAEDRGKSKPNLGAEGPCSQTCGWAAARGTVLAALIMFTILKLGSHLAIYDIFFSL